MMNVIPRRLNASIVEKTIRARAAAKKDISIVYIAKDLKTTHSDIIYHLNMHPNLRKLHTRLNSSANLAKIAERVKWLKEEIKNARKHITLTDLAESLSMPYLKLQYHMREGNLYDFYLSIHGPHMISQKTLDKICLAIDKAPPGAPKYEIKCGLNLSYYFKNFPELNDRYEKRRKMGSR